MKGWVSGLMSESAFVEEVTEESEEEDGDCEGVACI